LRHQFNLDFFQIIESAHDAADKFGNLTAKDFATVLADPHNMQVDRKDGGEPWQ
jgi:hypothetical protein